MDNRTNGPFLKVDSLSKTYRRGDESVPALRGVNLQVARGAVAVMGPSGGGKSTLLSLIGGLDRPTHGERY